MNFKQKIANYVIGNFTASDLPHIAMTGIIEKYESESLLILAGFLKNENSLEAEHYFKKALLELNIELPNNRDSSMKMIHYYADEILNDKIALSLGMHTILKKVLHMTSDWFEYETYDFDSFGFEKLYGLYWQLDDLENDEILITEKERKVMLLKVEEEIKNELVKWKMLKY
jgi:hypothetical protein